MTRAFVIIDEATGSLEFVGAYDPSAVEEIKKLPYRHRTFDKSSKSWTVDETRADELLEILERHFDQVLLAGPLIHPTPVDYRPYAKLHLLPTAPWEVVRAAYKALAMVNHPDKGGNPERMKLINEAYNQLKREGDAK